VAERAAHIAEWVRLTGEKEISAQLAPKIAKDGSTRGRPESGINAAVRELGIDRSEAQRAVNIAEWVRLTGDLQSAQVAPIESKSASAAGCAFCPWRRGRRNLRHPPSR
jgi:hypothetical protein